VSVYSVPPRGLGEMLYRKLRMLWHLLSQEENKDMTQVRRVRCVCNPNRALRELSTHKLVIWPVMSMGTVTVNPLMCYTTRWVTCTVTKFFTLFLQKAFNLLTHIYKHNGINTVIKKAFYLPMFLHVLWHSFYREIICSSMSFDELFCKPLSLNHLQKLSL